MQHCVWWLFRQTVCFRFIFKKYRGVNIITVKKTIKNKSQKFYEFLIYIQNNPAPSQCIATQQNFPLKRKTMSKSQLHAINIKMTAKTQSHSFCILNKCVQFYKYFMKMCHKIIEMKNLSLASLHMHIIIIDFVRWKNIYIKKIVSEWIYL